jgi:hydrogenase maturation protease
LRVRLRFLHLLERSAGWQEATEREVVVEADLGELLARSRQVTFSFPAARTQERRQQAIEGELALSARAAGEGLVMLTLCVRNLTPLDNAEGLSRDEALLSSFVSTHAILHVRGGAFVSLTDPPEACREAAAQCRNVGAWPVLASEEGAADTLLCSPIILADYPQVAPESPGELFDSTEIDEILTLRVLTLTEEEKRAMGTDERTRRLLERTEALTREQLLGLHGAMRSLQPPSGEAQP